MKEILGSICRDLPHVVQRPAPQIFTADFADSAIVYECRLFTRNPSLEPEIRDELLTRSYAALARAGMEIPFPQRTVHMASPPEDDRPRRARSALGRCPLFSGLPDGAVDALSGRSRWLRFAPGEPIVREGDHSGALYLVADGAVEVLRAGKVLGRLGAGEVFGEVAFLTGQERIATVRAATPAAVLEVDRDALSALLTEHEDIADELASRVAARQEQSRDELTAASDSPVPTGLVSLVRQHLRRLVGAADEP